MIVVHNEGQSFQRGVSHIIHLLAMPSSAYSALWLLCIACVVVCGTGYLVYMTVGVVASWLRGPAPAPVPDAAFPLLRTQSTSALLNPAHVDSERPPVTRRSPPLRRPKESLRSSRQHDHLYSTMSLMGNIQPNEVAVDIKRSSTPPPLTTSLASAQYIPRTLLEEASS